MVPVYYDSTNELWKKADETNKSKDYKWYDYNNKMWANSVTYDHTRAHNDGNTYEGQVFNGTSTYLNEENANYNFGKTITAAARFKLSPTGTTQYIVNNIESAGFYLYALASNKIAFGIYGTTAKTYKGVQSTTTIEKDKWYTAVGTYDGTTIKLYVDGNLEASLAVTDTIKASAYSIILGANPGPNGYSGFLKGTISDALVSKSVLSASEISKNYNEEDFNYQQNSNTVFYKKYGNERTYLTNTSIGKEGTDFDGTTSYIDAGYTNYNFGKTITVAIRYKMDANSTSNQVLVGNCEYAGFCLCVNSSNKIVFEVYGTTAKAYKGVQSTTTIEKDKWYTAVGTYDGTTIKLYVDGNLEASLAVTDTVKAAAYPIILGANPGPSGYSGFLKGTISDALVINSVLDASEISDYYSGEFNYQETAKTLVRYNLTGYETRENGTAVPMDVISTMQVWVPRYKYRVWNYNSDGTVTSEPQSIDIKFEDGTKTTGDIKCSDTISGTDGAKSESCKIDSVECTDSTCNNKYYTHPAFTFGTQELKGMWVGKFETTGTISDITIKPDVQSLRSQQVSAFETNIMAMNDSGNKYGFITSDDTHMMKNMEWGAVAYLSHSKYGINKEININNSSGYYTGRSGGNVGGSTPINGTYKEQTSTEQYNTFGYYTYDGYLLNYNTNTKSSTKDMTKIASTTGNIYGVYDMSGGAWDYVMGNIVSKDGKTMMSGKSNTGEQVGYHSGYTGILYENGTYTNYTGISYPENKYIDKYSFGTSNTQKQRSKLGDAVREVTTNSSTGWYSDHNIVASDSYPWVRRGGGYYSGSYAGAFSSNNGYGSTNGVSLARVVVLSP